MIYKFKNIMQPNEIASIFNASDLTTGELYEFFTDIEDEVKNTFNYDASDTKKWKQ